MGNLINVTTASEMREVVGSWRATHQTTALVPTMGNLHAGHLSLTEIACELVDKVIATVYVNPTQFGPGEDFNKYPRTLEADRSKLDRQETVNALFAPASSEVYPFGPGNSVDLNLPPLSRELCGASREGHFNGVAGVVLRLLNIVQPDLLVMGEKDFQQLVLMQRLVKDLCLPVRVISAPTVREDDGLAISSRNQYLSDSERARAPELHRSLLWVREAIGAGERDFGVVQARAREQLEAQKIDVDYVEVRDASSLEKVNNGEVSNDLVVLGAVHVGSTRLIDNVRVLASN